MTDVERAIFDGWRYLEKDALSVLSYTPREFTIMLRAQKERTHDEYERMAHIAVMHRQAQHAEKLSLSDLYKRPGESEDKPRIERLKENTRNANEWLAKLASSGVSRKE